MMSAESRRARRGLTQEQMNDIVNKTRTGTLTPDAEALVVIDFGTVSRLALGVSADEAEAVMVDELSRITRLDIVSASITYRDVAP